MKFTQALNPGFGKSKYFSGHGENPLKGDEGWLGLTGGTWQSSGNNATT